MGCTLSKNYLDKATVLNFGNLCEIRYDKENIYIGNLIIPKNDITNYFISKKSLFIISIIFLHSYYMIKKIRNDENLVSN